MVERALGPGETKDPAKLLPFIQQGRKLIIYHGASDPAIPAARSILFYHELATALHGVDKAEASVRLFLVPGMQHCSGGIGPDQFDTLSAIEAWVEHGRAPTEIAATTNLTAQRRTASRSARIRSRRGIPAVVLSAIRATGNVQCLRARWHCQINACRKHLWPSWPIACCRGGDDSR
jgi:hypothetical protein